MTVGLPFPPGSPGPPAISLGALEPLNRPPRPRTLLGKSEKGNRQRFQGKTEVTSNIFRFCGKALLKKATSQETPQHF